MGGGWWAVGGDCSVEGGVWCFHSFLRRFVCHLWNELAVRTLAMVAEKTQLRNARVRMIRPSVRNGNRRS